MENLTNIKNMIKNIFAEEMMTTAASVNLTDKVTVEEVVKAGQLEILMKVYNRISNEVFKEEIK